MRDKAYHMKEIISALDDWTRNGSGGRRERTKKKNNKRVLQKLYDSIRNNKVRIMAIAREEEREKKT